jgi:Ca2+-binding EF-hand superfamily protein
MASKVAAKVVFTWVCASLCAEAQEGAEGDYSADSVEDESLTTEQLHKLHSKFDSTSDGRASLEELMGFAGDITKHISRRDVQAIVEEIDGNKDGSLSLDDQLVDISNQADGGDETELKELAARKETETLKFNAADKNRDGVLDSEEVSGLFYPETDDAVLEITVQEAMKMKDTDGNGKLSPTEFWEAEDSGADTDLSEEENADFAKLDANGDGSIDLSELAIWESGTFHTLDAMTKLIQIADKDHDMHVTADELAAAREELTASDAHYHLIEWSEHLEL